MKFSVIFFLVLAFGFQVQAACPIADETNRYVVAPLRLEDTSPTGQKIRIYYRLAAPYDASKPTLLLITGGPGGDNTIMDMFNLLLPNMKDKLNIVSFDHRGLGCTISLDKWNPGWERGIFSMARSSGDIEAIRKDLMGEEGKWFVYGISYGTFLGQKYTTLYPDNILGITLDSAFYSYAGNTIARSQYKKLFIENFSEVNDMFNQMVEKYPESHDLFLRRIWSATYKYATRMQIKAFLQKILDAPSRDEAKKLFDPGPQTPLTGMTQTIACEEIWDYPAVPTNYFFVLFEQGCTLFQNFRTPMDYSPQLPNWKTRTMVWSGAFDPVTPVQANRAIASMVPGAFLWENPYAGHGLLREKTECAATLLNKFLDGESNDALASVAQSEDCQTAPKILADNLRTQKIDAIYRKVIGLLY